MLNSYGNTKEPDILEVISDLSNDEVFTPPSVAKQMLDLLPPDVWRNPSLRWIDPFTKTGVFLREITKRLLAGLKDEIPDEQKRLDHVLRNMVFGVAITELTSFMSRRSLYCSKWANSEKSVVKFPNEQGNLIYQRIEHEFFRGRCSECLAGEALHGGGPETENYAYALLHLEGRRFIEKEIGLKFDIVVGNPPYQTDSDGGTRSVPLYHLFVDQAKQLNPSHILMVTPSRWLAGGLGLDEFRSQMLTEGKLVKLVDYPNPKDVFPSVEIKGGVSYFLWSRDKESSIVSAVQFRNGEKTYAGERDLAEFDIFVRDGDALPILRKVLSKSSSNLEEMLSPRTAFGLVSNFNNFAKTPTDESSIQYYAAPGNKRVIGFLQPSQVLMNSDDTQYWKVLIPKAGSDGGQKLPDPVLGQTWIADPNSACSQTFLYAKFSSKAEAQSFNSYVNTRFVRFLVSLRKISVDTTRSSYKWVPTQDWDNNWTDEQLFAKYGLEDSEIAHIHRMVKER